jgi:protein-tyrosine phosphatase
MKTIWWIEEGESRRVAIVARPRGEEWLESELERLKNAGIDVLVSLLCEQEAQELGLADEGLLAEQLGMTFVSYPILDRGLPGDLAGFRELVARLASLVREGRRVGVHCRACIGRSTVLVASVLIALGTEADDALRRIKAARGLPVPDTAEQLEWILQFRAAA